ncbi:MAG: hypothetical protein OEU32_00735 [Acidimicrobiia bacterium]|nr:hypothetical protein [Acidimicrobiia bacterium]
MHPVERLRHVARSSGAPQALLVQETAAALSAFADDPNGLLTACRRMLARQPTSGPLLWLAANMLAAPDARAAGRDAVRRITDDPTPDELARALPSDATICILGWPDLAADALVSRADLDVLVVDVAGEGSGFVRRLELNELDCADVPIGGLGAAVAASDVLVVEASALGPDHAVAVVGSLAAAAVAATTTTETWMVAGVGRHLPTRMWSALERRLHASLREPWEADDERVALELVTCVIGPEGPEAPESARRHTDCPIVPELFGANDGIAL